MHSLSGEPNHESENVIPQFEIVTTMEDDNLARSQVEACKTLKTPNLFIRVISSEDIWPFVSILDGNTMIELMKRISDIELNTEEAKEKWNKSIPFRERMKQYSNSQIKKIAEANLKKLLEEVNVKQMESEFDTRLSIRQEESKDKSAPSGMVWSLYW